MSRSRNFTERDVFERVLSEIATKEGLNYQDVPTIYGDMSRLVVAWLAQTPTDELYKLYNALGWKGSANARAMHEAAKKWMQTYRPKSSDVGED